MPITESGCWIWLGGTNQGYGEFNMDGKRWRIHQYTYQHFVGPIIGGMTLDHLCRVRCCCNPEHLQYVSNRENILRGVGAPAQHARKQYCLRGHSLSGENLRMERRGNKRVCLACRTIREAKRSPRNWRKEQEDT